MITVLFVFLSACQLTGGAPAANSPRAKAADYTYIFKLPSAPAKADVTLDETRAVEAVIPTTGGELRASGADGTQYLLEIPGDALLAETKIRLLPAAVSSLPFGGGQTYAAQLEPEGLFFNNFATLTITPAQEIPLKEQLLFGYQAAGEDVIFAPPVVDSKEIKIRLLHKDELTQGVSSDPAAAPPAPDLSATLGSAEGEGIMPVFAVPAMSPGDSFFLADWEVTGGEYFAKKE